MATNTAASFTNHTGNGTAGPFSISFSYLSEAEVDVTVGGVLKTITTHYTFTSATQITFTSGNEPGNGVAIKFQRDTDISAKKVDFQDGSVLTETDLDTNADQVLFAQQEITDKLGGIEEGATADQTAAEIRTLVESATDSNVFTDADHTKLNGIETAATADQTAAEIRTLVESASDSNVFTDADHSKLNGIEASATADQTAAEIRTLVESASDSNVFTDADHSKLNAIEAGATTDQTASEIRALVESASDSNVFTDADHSKLNAIEANADVTDATNVDAAGAVMNSDLDTKGEILVGDGSGDPTALPVGQNGYILTADSSEATGIKWAANAGGGGGGAIGNVVEDTTPQLGGNLDVQANEINTSTTNGNIKLNPNGTGVVEIKGDGSSADGTLQLNCSQNSHGIKLKSPPHSASASYTFTFPQNIQNGQFLTTDANGNTSWSAIDLTALSASNLTSGTVPDARFPATLPAASAANLTAIPAANITGTLPAISAANLTNIPAANITGTLPAIDGSNLTGIGGGTGGGGEQIFFESENEMNTSYTISSNHNALVAGPLTIASGATLTINSPSVVTIP